MNKNLRFTLLLLNVLSVALQAREPHDKPNMIFIMADDLGYGDLGCYGQEKIKTPVLDQMARKGVQFRNFYAGCTVCASSRSVLMTGQHMGHTWVRGNAGADMSVQTLRPQDVTVAERLKAAGYTTALCGKWGLGDAIPGNTGLPNDKGFDFFYGYLNQVHAHNYYPEFLWRNKQQEQLRNIVQGVGRSYGGFEGGWATKRIDYSHDLVVQEALEFIERSKDSPFFLYLALTVPHANNEGTRGTGDGQEVPDYGIYQDKDWAKQDKGQAAMITRMDSDIGRLNSLLDKLGLSENTIVLFTSDNGHHNEGGHNPDTFDPNGPLRGMKRDLYEGGIRVPLIAYWPGTAPQGVVSDHIGYFGDLMSTACELSGVAAPSNIDSVSFAPTLRNNPSAQKQHQYLYWEFYEQGSKQAVREGKWKAIRMPMHTGEIELYDLGADLGEAKNIAARYPEVVKRMADHMQQSHVPNKNWSPRGSVRKNQPMPGDGKPRF